MRRPSLLMLALLLGGCTLSYPDVEDAPAPSGGRVIGRVVLPDGVAATALAGGHVELLGATPLQAPLGEGGRFAFEAVPAGAYGLQVRLRGYAGGVPEVVVAEAETTDVGEIPLRIEQIGGVRGVARRASGDTHEGIFVQVEGRPDGARTGPAGGYLIETTPGPHTLRFTLADHAPASLDVVVVADDEVVADEVVLVGLPGRVGGTVALPAGVDDPAILRATTLTLARDGDAEPRTTAPDDAGRFLFAEVPAGTWTLRVAHPTLRPPPERSVEVGVGAPVEVDPLVLTTAASVTLRGVARLEGAGEAGHADISVEVRGLAARTTTAPSGAWSLEVPPLDGYTLRFVRAGYGVVEVEVPALAPGDPYTVEDAVLSAEAGRVHGALALRGPDGEVLPFDAALAERLTLTLRDVGDAGAAPRVEAPLADGRFAFEGVPAGDYALQVELIGYDPPRVPPIALAPGEALNLGLLDLTPRVDAEVRGRVQLECVGACDQGGTRVQAARTGFVAFTAADGAFRLPLNAGTHDLTFTHPGYRPGGVDRVVVEGSVLLPAQPPLALLPTPITGRVERLRPTGGVAPVPDAAVALTGPDGPIDQGTTDADGRYRLTPSVQAGAYRLTVGLDRHADLTVPVRLQPGEPVDLGPVVLQPRRGGLTGAVALAGAPLATVRVRGVEGDALTDGFARDLVVAAPDARFALADVPVGPYRVTARADGARAPAWADVVVAADATVDQPVALRPVTAAIDLPTTLGGGDVVARIAGDDDLRHLRWWADALEPPDGLPFAELPEAATLDLAALDDGPHTLRFQLANPEHQADPESIGAAVSAVLVAEVLVDREAPVVRRVQVAGGQAVVHELIVPVTLEGEGDRLAVWNDADGQCADAPACPDSPRWLPFATALTHTLEVPEGPKRVCWQVCDDACNCTGGAVALTLGEYVARPAPVLDAVAPAEVDVLDLARLEADPLPDAVGGGLGLRLVGRGIAADTAARIGDEVFPCLVEGDTTDCTPDAGGGCAPGEGEPADPAGATCAARCARTCFVRLAADERLLRNAGTYPVRLVTPAPVSGDGQSEARFLDVVSPVPRIAETQPRGSIVVDLSRPELLSLFTLGPEEDTDLLPPVLPETIEVAVTACRVADNVRFRLGGSIGRPTEGLPTVELPTPVDGACAGQPTRRFHLTFDTDGFPDLPVAAQQIVAINPGPGGGEAPVRFGLGALEHGCMIEGLCVGALSKHAPPVTADQGLALPYQFDIEQRATGGLAWWGGDLFGVHRRYQGGDPALIRAGIDLLPRSAYQLRPASAGGLAPPSSVQMFLAGPLDVDGPQPRSIVRAATRRSDGRFAPAALLASVARDVADIAVTDLDEDGRLDVVAAVCGADAVAVLLQQPDGNFVAGDQAAVGRCPGLVRVADLNGDGHADLLTAGAEVMGQIVIRLGRGDGTFAPPVSWQVPPVATGDPGLAGLAVADLDHDGAVDVVASTADGRLVVRHGLGDGNLRAAVPVADGLPGMGAVALVDLDRDGRRDLVALEAAGGLRVWRGTGQRGVDVEPFHASWRAPTAPAGALAHGDLDADTLPDVVVGDCAGVTVWRGVGDGTLVAGADRPAPGCVTRLEIADVTGDGRADVVATHAGPGVVVYPGDGAGGLDAARPLAVPGAADAPSLVVADLELDGTQDVLVAVPGAADSTVQVLRGLGRRAFGEPRVDLAVGAYPWGLEPHDLDGDGAPDLVVLDRDLPGLVPLHNDGDGDLEPGEPILTPGFVPIAALSGDLDGDGAPELVVAERDGRTLLVLDADLSVARTVDLPAACQAPPARCADYADRGRDRLAFIDLDRDGQLALATTCGGDLALLADYDGAGAFATVEVLPHAGCTHGFARIDLGGRFALVADTGVDDTTRLTLDDRTLDLDEPDYQAPVGYLAGDFDHDGRDDLARAHVSASGATYQATFRRRWTTLRALSPDRLDTLARGDFALENQFQHGRLTHLADVNGDGFPDRVSNATGSYVQATYGHSPDFPDAWPESSNLRFATPATGLVTATVDLDRDGALDIATPAQRVAQVSRWLQASPGAWTLYHRPWLAPTIVPPGGGVARRDLTHAFYAVHAFALRVRVEGPNIAGTRLRLRTPRGDTIELGAAPADVGELWQPVWRAGQPGFEATLGVQPQVPWQLFVEGAADTDAAVVDAEIAVYASLQQTLPSRRADRPDRLRWGPAATGKAVHGTTLGGVDATDVGCADTAGGPEAWYALELPEANQIEVRLAAAFEGALELRRGRCEDDGPALACAAGRDARIPPTAVPAGTVCLVVDGQAGARTQAGPYDLFLSVETPLTPDCGDCALPPDPAGPDLDEPGVVACNHWQGFVQACDTRAGFTCCLGQYSSCERQCGSVTVPALCDGPEDCADGWSCCGGALTGAACAETCAPEQFAACHEDADCPGDTPCTACQLPFVGAVSVCTADCGALF
ncbi:MAG: carboxypeptidase regulatory-like domain-containing protein [Myxococcales bacterium]|nr:carboxypeptidase regulatory-like domain-containing protein [Myxococcales bacterium]